MPAERFARDSLLEGDGFELPVPPTTPHNASRQMPQKGSSDQAVACLRRLGTGAMGSAVACAFRFRPPGTGNKRAGWRRSGAFFGAVCFEPDASRARLRFKAVMRSMTGRPCPPATAFDFPSRLARGRAHASTEGKCWRFRAFGHCPLCEKGRRLCESEQGSESRFAQHLAGACAVVRSARCRSTISALRSRRG